MVKKYVLSAFEAEKFILLIKDEHLLRLMERIYPKSKIMMLKGKVNGFKAHISKSFRIREYNMSPLKKKSKAGDEKNNPSMASRNVLDPNSRVMTTFDERKNKISGSNGNYFTVTDKSFNDSINVQDSLIDPSSKKNAQNVFFNPSGSFGESPQRQNTPKTSPILHVKRQSLESSSSFQKYEMFRKSFERRLSTNTQNDSLISDLNRGDKRVLHTILDRAHNDIASLFYIANSLVTALVNNLDDQKSIDILMILSLDKNFLSELDYLTLRILHLEIIKDIQEKGGDILINLCLNAPVHLLIKVYLNVLDTNKEIILKLIWRNSKRKYASDYREILDVYEVFFNKGPRLDEMSFKIVQLHICEIVKEIGQDVLEIPTSGTLRKILCGMLERRP